MVSRLRPGEILVGPVETEFQVRLGFGSDPRPAYYMQGGTEFNFVVGSYALCIHIT